MSAMKSSINVKRFVLPTQTEDFIAFFSWLSPCQFMVILIQSILCFHKQIRLKNSNPENLILNGRAALCAGRDDMSSEEEEENDNDFEGRADCHKFSQPAEFDFKFESGAIPDAAMIHAARKKRQKAREQGKM